MVGILIDMYAQNRTPFAQTEKFLQSLEVGVRDHFIYDSMIRAFAKHGHPEMATPLLLSVLDSSGAVNVSPNAGTFARVISAWAESSLPQALEQATAVFRHLESHPVCVEARVRPTTVIYGSLLKCLSVSKRPDSGKSAVAILDDMTSKSSSDATIRPDLIVYTLVIKTCLHAGDTERFQEVWKRMQQSDTPPNVRTYSDVLNHYAETGTLAGARQAHQILLEMKSNAAIKNPDPESTSIQQAAVQPNSFTYNIVVKAWCRSGDESATERIWEIYQMSLADGISPDVFMYSQLIHHLCTSGKIDNVRRSDLALQAMEEDSTIAGKTFSLYSHVLQSYAKLGDADNASRVLIRIIEVYLSGGFVNSRSKPGQKQQQQQPPAQYPRPILFQTVIWAWIRSGQVLQATLIADKLQELHDAKRIPEGPDLRVYQTLLAAWNESKQLGHDKDNEDESRAQKARHVRRLQDRIENLERRQKSQT